MMIVWLAIICITKTETVYLKLALFKSSKQIFVVEKIKAYSFQHYVKLLVWDSKVDAFATNTKIKIIKQYLCLIKKLTFIEGMVKIFIKLHFFI